jgi:hypothetical protein
VSTPKRTRDNGWTQRELAMVAKCLERNYRPRACMSLFPRRSVDSVQGKFTARRTQPKPDLGRIPTAIDLEWIQFACKDVPNTVSDRKIPGASEPVDPFSGFAKGCQQLLQRQLITGQHNITCPVKFAVACRAAGLVAVA